MGNSVYVRPTDVRKYGHVVCVSKYTKRHTTHTGCEGVGVLLSMFCVWCVLGGCLRVLSFLCHI